MEKKSDLYKKFDEWKSKAERDTDKAVKILRCDGGGEYQKLAEIWTPKGVEFEFTTPYTPEQNGYSERLNRTITESMRSMLFDSKLPVEFWGEAAKTAAYIQNRLPLGDDYGAKTPYKIYTGHKPSVKHLRPFGCVAYCYIPKEKRSKLENKAYRTVFVGYCRSNHQFRVWNPLKKEVEIHTHVFFAETTKGGDLLENPHQFDENWESPIDLDTLDDDDPPILTPEEIARRRNGSGGALFENPRPAEPVGEISEDDNNSIYSEEASGTIFVAPCLAERPAEHQAERPEEHLLERPAEQLMQPAEQPIEQALEPYTTRSGQILKPNPRYFASVALGEKIHEPTTYKEAMASPSHR